MDVESEDSHNSDLEKSAMNIDEWGIVEQRETFYEDDIVREYGGNFHNDKYNDICLIKYNDIINIFGTQLLLYPTFVDQNEAITNISVKLDCFHTIIFNTLKLYQKYRAY